MFIPKYPETMDVAAPIMNARVENIPLYNPGARKIPASSSFHVEENPSSELRNTKITTENSAMKTLTYLYSVNRKLFAPSLIASCKSAAFSSIYMERNQRDNSLQRQLHKDTSGREDHPLQGGTTSDTNVYKETAI